LSDGQHSHIGKQLASWHVLFGSCTLMGLQGSNSQHLLMVAIVCNFFKVM
jgi:hypothetical protein